MATVEEGAVASFTCVALDSRGVVVSTLRSWTISDPTVATVAANGDVAAQHAGTAVASCTADGKTATATITVVGSPVAFLELIPGAGVLGLDKSIQLVATLSSRGAGTAVHASGDDSRHRRNEAGDASLTLAAWVVATTATLVARAYSSTLVRADVAGPSSSEGRGR